MRAAPSMVLSFLSVLLFAFSSAVTFENDASVGGGGGYTFTGAQTSHWMSCTTCHEPVGSPIHLELSSEPEGLFTEGYEPDAQYTLHLSMPDERYGLEHNGGCIEDDKPCNRNGFAVEVLVAGDQPVGVLCPTVESMEEGVCTSSTGKAGSIITDPSATRVAIIGQTLEFPAVCGQGGGLDNVEDEEDCLDIQAMVEEGLTQDEIEALIASNVRGRTEWTFAWKAPPKGKGYVGIFLAAVDGDGGRTYDPYYADYAGDGVAVHRYELAEKGGPPKAQPWVEVFAGARLESPGCGLTRNGHQPSTFLTLVVILFFVVRRNTRCIA